MESPLVEHSLETHGNRAPSFSMEVVSFLRTDILRQATEAAKIQSLEGGNLLNRRGEWGQNLPPKLIVEDHNGDTTNTTGAKRKVEHQIAPMMAQECNERHTSADQVTPMILEDTSILDGEVQRKRARMSTRVQEQKRSGPQLAPAKSNSRSVKQMLEEMSVRKAR